MAFQVRHFVLTRQTSNIEAVWAFENPLAVIRGRTHNTGWNAYSDRVVGYVITDHRPGSNYAILANCNAWQDYHMRTNERIIANVYCIEKLEIWVFFPKDPHPPSCVIKETFLVICTWSPSRTRNGSDPQLIPS